MSRFRVDYLGCLVCTRDVVEAFRSTVFLAGIERQVGSSVCCGTVLEAVGSRFHIHGAKRGGEGGRGAATARPDTSISFEYKTNGVCLNPFFKKKSFPICLGALFVPAQGKLRFRLGE